MSRFRNPLRVVLLLMLAVPFRAARADATPLDELMEACFFDREPEIIRLLDENPDLVNDEKKLSAAADPRVRGAGRWAR